MKTRGLTMSWGMAGAGRPVRAGFTLVELVFTITVIGVLMALTAVVVGGAVRTARAASERYYLGSLRLSVEHFKQAFGFYPPLVDSVFEAPPAVGGGVRIAGAFDPNTLTNSAARANQFLEDPTQARYSVFSLPVYLLGMAELADGYPGAGQGRPREDGTWDPTSPKVEPFFDPSRDRERLVPFQGFSVLRDRWGHVIRYYRWEPTVEPRYLQGGASNPAFGELKSHNIPGALYDASEATFIVNQNAGVGMRSGRFAIVSAGPDGLIDDGPSAGPNWMAWNKDNLVEVGQ